MIDNDVMIAVLREQNSDLNKLVTVQEAQINIYRKLVETYTIAVENYEDKVERNKEIQAKPKEC